MQSCGGGASQANIGERIFVIVGALLFLFGLFLLGYGAKMALYRAKPWSYVGMLVAPAGALLAMTGLGRLLNSNFFGS